MTVASRTENVKWVDGLRGVASILVVFTHLTRAFDPNVFQPTDALGKAPRFPQWPFIRVLLQGRIGVPIFSLVTGYVCALKPIRQLAAGNQEGALKGMTKSAFRRVPRLVIPTSIITVAIWLMCELGALDVAHHCESGWIMYTSPPRLPIGEALVNLAYYLINTWVRSVNGYESNQWTLLPLLRGAFLVYMMLFATCNMQPRYRMVVELGMFVYYVIAHDPEWGTQFFFGAFICDLSQYPPYLNWIAVRKWPGRIATPILLVIGLLCASYPEKEPQLMPWSNNMELLSHWIFPKGQNNTPRFYSALGLWCITIALQFSDPLKNILSNKYLLFAGKVSFAVYLLHGTLLRTLLVWVLFGFSVPPDIIGKDGKVTKPPLLKLPNRFLFWFWIVVWLIVQYYLANLWMNTVDPWCARLTEKLEKYVFKETTKPEASPVATRPVEMQGVTTVVESRPLMEGILPT